MKQEKSSKNQSLRGADEVRNIDLLIDAEEVSTVIKDFIHTYVKTSGCKGVVIGLSGGLDSAIAAILCREILGKDQVLCLFLPDGATPKEDFEHVEHIGKQFDLQWKQIVIAPIVAAIQQVFMDKEEKMVVSNIKARTRMMLLYAHANKIKRLVCGTSNKSELLVGYFTKYGDGGVDFQPLGDLYKTQIRQLGSHLRLPRSLLLKPPTAGLWRGQTDEKELKMSYETLDKILYGLEQKLSIKEIQNQANVKRSEVERIHEMRKTSQHKRRSPLIPKIGLRTVGLDWRSPVQEG